VYVISDGNYFCYTRREPVGVVGAITPVSVLQLFVCYSVNQKNSVPSFGISAPNIGRLPKLFCWHTLVTVCNKLVIQDPSTSEMHCYCTL